MPQQIPGVLVGFSYSFLSGSKRDPVISHEVNQDKNASDDAGSWSNKLFPSSSCGKTNAFTTCRAHLAAMRKWHYNNTYIFEDSLWRILPEKRIEAYKSVVETDGKARALELLESFLGELPNLIDLARIGRGDAFREEDYPTASEVKKDFAYCVDYRPVPSSAGLNPALMQEAIDKLNAMHAQRMQEAQVTLVARMIAPFQTLSEQLADPKNRKISNVLGSIQELMAVVPSLDLSGNQQLAEIVGTIQSTFATVTPEAVKEDEEMRKKVSEMCGNVINSLHTFANVGGAHRKFA